MNGEDKSGPRLRATLRVVEKAAGRSDIEHVETGAAEGAARRKGYRQFDVAHELGGGDGWWMSDTRVPKGR